MKLRKPSSDKGLRAATKETPPAYPSVREHLLSRRRALRYLGASLLAGASTLTQGCSTFDRSTPGAASDASTSYLTLRIPQQGELSAELADAAQCRFHVFAIFYDQILHDQLQAQAPEAEQACIDAVSQYTYSDLETTGGVLTAEADVTEALYALNHGVTEAILTVAELMP